MIINVNVTEKRAQALGSPVIVCGNTDNSIEFTFDEEWAGSQTRTARFVYIQEGEVKHTDVVFNGAACEVPLLSNTREVKVGVFAGELMTTTAARIPCEPSILCGTATPEDPTPSQYDQIMALLNEKQTLDAVTYSAQDLGAEQQQIARDNIGAAAQADLEEVQTDGIQLAQQVRQELQQQLGTTEQQLSKRITQNQTELSSLIEYTSEAVTNLQDQVDKKAEVDTFTLTWNEETEALETDDATLTALVEALDAARNIDITLIRGTGQIHGFVTSHGNRFLSAFDYMRRRLWTWRVYDDEVPLYHSIGLYDDPILERGETEDGWHIRKYDSGDAECWREVIYSVEGGVAAGGDFRFSTPYPFAFSQNPMAFIHPTLKAYQLKKAYQLFPNDLDNKKNLMLYAQLEDDQSMAAADNTVAFYVHVKGRWK